MSTPPDAQPDVQPTSQAAAQPAAHPASPTGPPRPDLLRAPAEFRTPRLSLQSPRPDHAEAFADGVAATMPALAYVAWGLKPRSIEWARRFCEDDATSVAAGEDLAFHVFALHDGAWVGRIDFHSIDFSAARGEVGYVGDLRHAGRGLMREAVLAVIDLAFALGFERVEAMSDARNTRALHFARTLGLQHEGVMRHHERDGHGQFCDMVLFAAINPHPADGFAASRLLAPGRANA